MIETQVRGADRVAAGLRAAARDLGQLDHDQVAAPVVRAARARAPKRSGALARSISGGSAPGNTARFQATVVYAGVIHNGWRRHNISPNPFLADTITATQATWEAAYTEQVQAKLDRIQGA